MNLIASYTDSYETWLEYGLQSIHDKTLKFINRGHNYQTFVDAYKKSKERNIKVCAHVILGLPEETREQMLDTAKALADLNIDGVKIHALCVLENTLLSKMYQNNEIKLLDEDEYVNLVCDFLEILPRSTTIQRLAGNGLQSEKIAPMWLNKKFEVLNKIDRELIRRSSAQGSKFMFAQK